MRLTSLVSGDVDQALFEGLFRRGLTLDEALAASLEVHGYDASRPRPRYPGHVFAACVEAARAARHPSLPVDEGLRQLGAAFVTGFQETILGKIITTALPILGPARFLPRLPVRFRSLRTDATVVVDVTDANSATLVFTDPLPLGPFFAGVVEAALRLANAPSPSVTVNLVPGGYQLLARF